MNKKILFVFSIVVCFHQHSSAYYDFDNKLQLAYSSIFSLHFNEAELLLQQEKIEKPGNDLRLLYLNYIDFLKAFISEEKSEFENLKKNSTVRLNEINNDKNNFSSPFHLYVQAEILLQQALVRIKFNENIISAGEIRKANKLISRNEVIFPTFILNKKVSALLLAIVGSVPTRYNWIIKIAGMDGSIPDGFKELSNLYESIDATPFICYRTEILFYLGNIYSIFGSDSDSFPFQTDLKQLAGENPLIAFVFSNILIKQGNNDEARVILDSVLRNNSTYPFIFLYFKRGLTRLRKLDLSSEKDFEYYLLHFHGQNNIKAAYQKLAWISILKGDTVKYKQEHQFCREEGNSIIDEDKVSQEEAESDVILNIYLLRSRLLFDGGYYNKALSEITGKSIEDFPRYRDQLEITYRLGRIMQKKGQIDKAISYFEMTIKNGLSSRYYYAANSALMLGLIFEDEKRYDKSKFYFQKCLSVKNEQYKNSIDQKANAGLDRISKLENLKK